MNALSGCNIVVTRPRDQAVSLAQRIIENGGNSILFPLLEISPVAAPLPLRQIVARLTEFNLAIFISPNAVRFGMEAVDALPPSLKIATVGQGSAKALRALGVPNILAPQDKFDSEALLALPELQNVAGWRVVIFRGDAGRELLGDTLKARGATVEYAACYQRAKPQHDAATLFAAQPNIITVTSSEAVAFLYEMLDASQRKIMQGLPLFVQHERIAQAAQKLGWQKIVTTAGGDDGLLEGLIAFAAQKKL
ncbi:MAG: uroporphyrinogen-III synthase [Gallionella sp.]|nr:uroporphyrinogen-III synthase [Gallionella sp.]